MPSRARHPSRRCGEPAGGDVVAEHGPEDEVGQAPFEAAHRFHRAYAACKFGVEGFREGLAFDIARFGIRTMLVEPGFFRTELRTPQSTQYAPPSIADYSDRTTSTIEAWRGMDGKQSGDPAKLAAALFETKARTLLTQADAHRGQSSNLTQDDA